MRMSLTNPLLQATRIKASTVSLKWNSDQPASTPCRSSTQDPEGDVVMEPSTPIQHIDG